MEKTLNLWIEDINRKQIPIDSNMLDQKILSLYKDFSKGSPEINDTKSSTASKWVTEIQEKVWSKKMYKLLEKEREPTFT